MPIDLVVTGDRATSRTATPCPGVREALLNAVRHGSPPVTAYVEMGPDAVEAFVRDRGYGFDVDAVPDDRLGVRQSIIGRMERHGGTARMRRRERRHRGRAAPADRSKETQPEHPDSPRHPCASSSSTTTGCSAPGSAPS